MDVSLIYDRLLALTDAQRANMSRAERILFCIFNARCAKDMDGFRSVFDQTLNEGEVRTLIEGLGVIGEKDLAESFSKCLKILLDEGFYEHNDMRKVPDSAWERIGQIRDEIGDRLWDLDEKLEALVKGEWNRNGK